MFAISFLVNIMWKIMDEIMDEIMDKMKVLCKIKGTYNNEEYVCIFDRAISLI